MLVGIEYNTLMTMLVMAFLTPIVFFLVAWLFWIPKPSKTYITAKITKADVDIEANENGNLHFKRGRVSGLGIFTTRKEEINFLPGSPEPWVNKRFAADKVGTIISYAGMALAVGFEHMAVMQANQSLHRTELLGSDNPSSQRESEKQQKKSEVTMNVDLSVLPEGVRKSLSSAYMTLPETTGKPTKKTKLIRTVAMLLDPRLLKFYNTKMWDPAQIEFMKRKAYEKGYKEGQKPLLQRAIPLLIALALLIMAAAMFIQTA